MDLAAIGRNLDRVRRRTKVPIMGVVKANAYGHGLVEVGRFLESAGVAALMTGKLDEAARLREAGVRCPIANFGPFGHADAGRSSAAGSANPSRPPPTSTPWTRPPRRWGRRPVSTSTSTPA